MPRGTRQAQDDYLQDITQIFPENTVVPQNVPPFAGQTTRRPEGLKVTRVVYKQPMLFFSAMWLTPAGVKYLETQEEQLVRASMYPMCAWQLLLNLRMLPKKSKARSSLKSNWPTARLIGKLPKQGCMAFFWHRKVAGVQLGDLGIWPLKQ